VIAKRIFDVVVSSLGLLLLSPLMLAIAVAVKLDSPGPVFFRQERVGRYGRTFRIFKFRSMVSDADRRGGPLTIGRDPRVTAVGHVLRRYKLDELPQLIDVVRGEMSLVGPRPELPRYVDRYSVEDRAVVLSVRPGITDRASVAFLDESSLLAEAADPEDAYVREILPIKLRAYRAYVEGRTFGGDLRILLETLFAIGR
jgi:lipopolysaccharide/colanic/teichoic acid biosynthesis glycosyltransferase